MSGHTAIQLQTKLFDVLTAALLTAGPASAPVKVYDHVPQGDPLDYVMVGDGTRRPFDTSTEIGEEHDTVVHAYSRGRGRKACLELLKKIYDALHAQNLTLSAGAALVYIFRQSEDVLRESDGVTYHGIAVYRAATTEA